MPGPGRIHRAGIFNAAREFFISGHIEAPTTGKAYVLDLLAKFDYEIMGATVQGLDTTDPSACDIEFLIEGVGIPGMDFTSVDLFNETPKTQTSTGTQTLDAGESLTLVADGFTATPDDIYFTLHCREPMEVNLS